MKNSKLFNDIEMMKMFKGASGYRVYQNDKLIYEYTKPDPRMNTFYWLARLRDYDWMPKLLVDFIDWFRYKFFWRSWYD